MESWVEDVGFFFFALYLTHWSNHMSSFQWMAASILHILLSIAIFFHSDYTISPNLVKKHSISMSIESIFGNAYSGCQFHWANNINKWIKWLILKQAKQIANKLEHLAIIVHLTDDCEWRTSLSYIKTGISQTARQCADETHSKQLNHFLSNLVF